MSLILERLPRCLVRYFRGRLIIAAILALLLVLQWWTWARRHPILSGLHEQIHRIEELELRVSELERSWPKDEEEEAREALLEAEKRLFTGSPESGAWSEEVITGEEGLAIAARAEISDDPLPHPRHPSRILIAPTIWQLDLKAAGNPDLATVLTFLENLADEQPKRMDFVHLAVSGNGENLTKIELSLDLWFKKS